VTSTSSPVLLARVCGGCQDIIPLAVTPSGDTFYLGWICPRCLIADVEDGLLDVLGVYATREDAEWELLIEEDYASLEPPDPGLAEAPDHEYPPSASGFP
jgi:hypothetical protein